MMFLAAPSGAAFFWTFGQNPGRPNPVRAVVLIVFVVVYAAMILGRLPGLALDRAGAAVLGALALIAAGTMTVTDAWAAADVPTLALLFGLMVISAQLRLGGFYTAVSRALIAAYLDAVGPHENFNRDLKR